MRFSADAWIGAAAAGAIAVLLAASDAKLFEEAPESPLYRQTLEKAYDRFREDDARVPAGGGAPARTPPASTPDDGSQPPPEGAAGPGGGSAHDHSGPHFAEGNRLDAEGRLEPALAEFRAALAEHPGCPLANHRIADILVQQGKPEEALARYGEVLKEQPDYACVYEHIGDIRRSRNETGAAEAMYAKAVEGYRGQSRQPGGAGAGGKYRLARFDLEHGRDLPEALALARELAAATPPEVSHLDLLARCHEALGQPAEALSVIDRLLAMRPDLAAAYEGYRERLRASAGAGKK